MTAEAATLRELLQRAYCHLPADVWRGQLGREIREALGNPLPSDRTGVHAMLGAGMSVRDVADALRVHPSAVKAIVETSHKPGCPWLDQGIGGVRRESGCTCQARDAAACLCTVTATERHEHPQCPRHVIDERRRMRQ